MSPRIAAAPISWGVCEVPGWGHQLSPERVLTEMRDLGFTASEFGPDGFLPDDPAAKTESLAQHGLGAVGAFVPVVLHSETDPLPGVEALYPGFEASGAKVLILAAATGVDGYDAARPVLTEDQWARVLENLERIEQSAAAAGLSVVVHPHAGTMVENAAELDRVVTGTAVGICIDTGHMLIGGIDPVAFVREHAGRVGHVHLKDVRLSVVDQVRAGDLSYYDGVVNGLYSPLGEGDVDVPSILADLTESGYDGWYVLEQDVVITDEPAPGEGPLTSAKASLDYLTAHLTSNGDQA